MAIEIIHREGTAFLTTVDSTAIHWNKLLEFYNCPDPTEEHPLNNQDYILIEKGIQDSEPGKKYRIQAYNFIQLDIRPFELSTGYNVIEKVIYSDGYPAGYATRCLQSGYGIEISQLTNESLEIAFDTSSVLIGDLKDGDVGGIIYKRFTETESLKLSNIEEGANKTDLVSLPILLDGININDIFNTIQHTSEELNISVDRSHIQGTDNILSTLIQSIDMGDNRIFNLQDPIEIKDAINLSYLNETLVPYIGIYKTGLLSEIESFEDPQDTDLVLIESGDPLKRLFSVPVGKLKTTNLFHTNLPNEIKSLPPLFDDLEIHDINDGTPFLVEDPLDSYNKKQISVGAFTIPGVDSTSFHRDKSNEFNLPHKNPVNANDRLLIEDSEVGFEKRYTTISELPTWNYDAIAFHKEDHLYEIDAIPSEETSPEQDDLLIIESCTTGIKSKIAMRNLSSYQDPEAIHINGANEIFQIPTVDPTYDFSNDWMFFEKNSSTSSLRIKKKIQISQLMGSNAGTVTNAQNIGIGNGIFKKKEGTLLQFKSLSPITDVSSETGLYFDVDPQDPNGTIQIQLEKTKFLGYMNLNLDDIADTNNYVKVTPAEKTFFTTMSAFAAFDTVALGGVAAWYFVNKKQVDKLFSTTVPKFNDELGFLDNDKLGELENLANDHTFLRKNGNKLSQKQLSIDSNYLGKKFLDLNDTANAVNIQFYPEEIVGELENAPSDGHTHVIVKGRSNKTDKTKKYTIRRLRSVDPDILALGSRVKITPSATDNSLELVSRSVSLVTLSQNGSAIISGCTRTNTANSFSYELKQRTLIAGAGITIEYSGDNNQNIKISGGGDAVPASIWSPKISTPQPDDNNAWWRGNKQTIKNCPAVYSEKQKKYIIPSPFISNEYDPASLKNPWDHQNPFNWIGYPLAYPKSFKNQELYGDKEQVNICIASIQVLEEVHSPDGKFTTCALLVPNPGGKKKDNYNMSTGRTSFKLKSLLSADPNANPQLAEKAFKLFIFQNAPDYANVILMGVGIIGMFLSEEENIPRGELSVISTFAGIIGQEEYTPGAMIFRAIAATDQAYIDGDYNDPSIIVRQNIKDQYWKTEFNINDTIEIVFDPIKIETMPHFNKNLEFFGFIPEKIKSVLDDDDLILIEDSQDNYNKKVIKGSTIKKKHDTTIGTLAKEIAQGQLTSITKNYMSEIISDQFEEIYSVTEKGAWYGPVLPVIEWGLIQGAPILAKYFVGRLFTRVHNELVFQNEFGDMEGTFSVKRYNDNLQTTETVDVPYVVDFGTMEYLTNNMNNYPTYMVCFKHPILGLNIALFHNDRPLSEYILCPFVNLTIYENFTSIIESTYQSYSFLASLKHADYSIVYKFSLFGDIVNFSDSYMIDGYSNEFVPYLINYKDYALFIYPVYHFDNKTVIKKFTFDYHINDIRVFKEIYFYKTIIITPDILIAFDSSIGSGRIYTSSDGIDGFIDDIDSYSLLISDEYELNNIFYLGFLTVSIVTIKKTDDKKIKIYMSYDGGFEWEESNLSFSFHIKNSFYDSSKELLTLSGYDDEGDTQLVSKKFFGVNNYLDPYLSKEKLAILDSIKSDLDPNDTDLVLLESGGETKNLLSVPLSKIKSNIDITYKYEIDNYKNILYREDNKIYETDARVLSTIDFNNEFFINSSPFTSVEEYLTYGWIKTTDFFTPTYPHPTSNYIYSGFYEFQNDIPSVNNTHCYIQSILNQRHDDNIIHYYIEHYINGTAALDLVTSSITPFTNRVFPIFEVVFYHNGLDGLETCFGIVSNTLLIAPYVTPTIVDFTSFRIEHNHEIEYGFSAGPFVMDPMALTAFKFEPYYRNKFGGSESSPTYRFISTHSKMDTPNEYKKNVIAIGSYAIYPKEFLYTHVFEDSSIDDNYYTGITFISHNEALVIGTNLTNEYIKNIYKVNIDNNTIELLSQIISYDNYMAQIVCVSKNTIIVATDSFIFKSIDNGLSFVEVKSFSLHSEVHAYGTCYPIIKSIKRNIIVCARGWEILISFDNGNHWTSIMPSLLFNNIILTSVSYQQSNNMLLVSGYKYEATLHNQVIHSFGLKIF